jgi:sec-independent protein translocase protein TatA
MLLFFDVSGGEIVVILLFVLIFFGSKKIPEMARGLGRGMREIKDASDAIKREIQHEGNKIRDELNEISKSLPEAIEQKNTPVLEKTEAIENSSAADHHPKEEDPELPKPHPGSTPRTSE